jgi:hypothetical protein
MSRDMEYRRPFWGNMVLTPELRSDTSELRVDMCVRYCLLQRSIQFENFSVLGFVGNLGICGKGNNFGFV